MNLFKLTSPVLLSLFLAGCSGLPSAPISEPVSSPYTAREDALGSLLDEAWQARQSGRLEDADGWLTRAMRINPSSPEVYYHMALLRQQQGQLEQAKQLAGRALSLGPEHQLERQLNHLLNSLKS